MGMYKRFAQERVDQPRDHVLIFDVIIGDVVQMLKEQNLEHQHQIAGFTTGLS